MYIGLEHITIPVHYGAQLSGSKWLPIERIGLTISNWSSGP